MRLFVVSLSLLLSVSCSTTIDSPASAALLALKKATGESTPDEDNLLKDYISAKDVVIPRRQIQEDNLHSSNAGEQLNRIVSEGNPLTQPSKELVPEPVPKIDYVDPDTTRMTSIVIKKAEGKSTLDENEALQAYISAEDVR